jgi:hypothetical protein
METRANWRVPSVKPRFIPWEYADGQERVGKCSLVRLYYKPAEISTDFAMDRFWNALWNDLGTPGGYTENVFFLQPGNIFTPGSQ